ncbi:MbcA/ParS/Xre antitoxin family protein [Burkholderia sp. Leaf177]|uniref:MbcA/ParS/Xre antitoxin family protein n=1 Tax=Burkholderia sp. Leaf177 TaxID=1736287 RepID=UPI0009E84536|nr:MbcA/ParS/Xre antitoxin family protein [Burkholderia sp. Leaf177]
MSKPVTIRHARASTLSASTVSASTEPKPRSKPLHAKVRDTAIVKSISERSSVNLRAVDLDRLISVEVTRQLLQSGVEVPVPDATNPQVRELRDYAYKVFGNTAKGDRWLLRPSTKLNGVRPIDHLDTPENSNAVYSALDAIAYGFPV